MTRTCSACGKDKPLTTKHFYRRGAGFRQQCISCVRNRQGSTTKTIAGGGRLPVGPFRAWMERRLAFYGGSMELLAKATGLDDRQIRRVLREADSVALDTVDRALINEGSTPLWALDYSEEDFQRAAREISKREKVKA